MEFSVITGSNGVAEMSWDAPEDISTIIWTSLNVKKGSLFNVPEFGVDLSDIKKVTSSKVDLIKTRFEAALQWILDIGKAKSITVIVERNKQDKSRIDYKVEAVQADGIPVTVESFRTVGGTG